MSVETKLAKKVEKKNYDEMRVEVEPGRYTFCNHSDPKIRERELVSWAKEILDFLRDHRSMDINDVCVVVPVFDACSECGAEWEPWDDDGVLWCASCGAACE